jgi:hypothetical protein
MSNCEEKEMVTMSLLSEEEKRCNESAADPHDLGDIKLLPSPTHWDG